MRISFNWLKQHINFDISPENLSEKLTSSGLEVESIEEVFSIKGGLEGLVCAEVLECEKHPNADKLKITKVDNGNEILSVVCGAANVAKGQKVVLAQVGSTIYPIKGQSITIKKAEIRGLESQGMLCAEDEIGLGNSHDGIIVLDENIKVGTPASEIFSVEKDILIEIGLTANRGDAASHLGVARELSALLNIPKNKIIQNEIKVSENKYLPNIEIENSEYCKRYAAVVIEIEEIVESPNWLKNRLKIIGLNPVNLLVDVTNFILHDLGQPLHAFDYDKICNQKIKVGLAQKDEKFTALDGKEYHLSGSELSIKNENNETLCLAGVYGGLESGVSANTKTIMLESAYFSPDFVRKTAKKHAINTDSSFRFERGTNPEMIIFALEKAVKILNDNAKIKVCSPVVDVYPEKCLPFEVNLKKSNILKVLGTEIPNDKIEQILSNLEIEIVEKNYESWQLRVPFFKSDVTREIDVIEELIRIYGFENVPLKREMNFSLPYHKSNPKEEILNQLSEVLVGMGFSEIMTNSLSSDKFYDNKETLVYIENPLSSDLNVMRQTMLFGMLDSVAHNKNRKTGNTLFYEVGFNYSLLNNQYKEEEKLAFAVSGFQTELSWETKQKPADFYFLKSIVERVCHFFNSENIFKISEIDSKILKKFSIKEPVYFIEISLRKLIENKVAKIIQLQEIPVFPSMKRDLSIIIDKNTEYATVYECAKTIKNIWLKNITLFDIYEGKPLNENQKSMSLNFEFINKERTLTDTEIDELMLQYIHQFELKLNAQIRK